jgi:MoaA/NifB/PqqE/SkfB family radical SAM enzyme
MKYISNIKKIQFELSNFCNANCIGCRRTDHRTLTEKYEIRTAEKIFLDLDIIDKIVNDTILENVSEIEFCGTIDEPLAHAQFLEIIQLLFNVNPNYNIRIHTNGAIRNIDFYKKLARLLVRFKAHEVRFSIDGLEENHRLYRGNLDYNKILANAKSLIEAGGNATWQMLIFPWNVDDEDACRNIAADMGFKKFLTRRDRTHSSSHSVEQIKKKRLENLPAPAKIFNAELVITEDDTEVVCHYQKENMIFVNHEAKLYPCCFMANMDITRISDISTQFNMHVKDKYGENFNSLYHYTPSEILNHEWFNEKLTASWENKYISEENPKLLICAKSCGKKAPPIKNHFSIQDLQ